MSNKDLLHRNWLRKIPVLPKTQNTAPYSIVIAL